jgi:hypothetical protein
VKDIVDSLKVTASPLEVAVLLVTLAVALRLLPLARLAWRERAWALDAGSRANEGEVAIAMWRFDNNVVKLAVVWACVLIALYAVLLPASTSRPPEGGDWLPWLRRIGVVLVPVLILTPVLVVAWSNERAYRWRRQQNDYLRGLKARAGGSGPSPAVGGAPEVVR